MLKESLSYSFILGLSIYKKVSSFQGERAWRTNDMCSSFFLIWESLENYQSNQVDNPKKNSNDL